MATGRRPGTREARRTPAPARPSPVRPVPDDGACVGADDAVTAPVRSAPGASGGSGPRRAGGSQTEWERSREHAETFVAEDELLGEVRARSAERGVLPMGTGAASALTFLAAATGARAAVEIGTGLGVSAISLLRGMAPDGLLTSIDVDAAHQREARAACVEAGFGPGRLRMITGRALDVLPRLSDAAYDLVVVDAVTTEYPQYLTEAVRLLRRGGVVALDNALWSGRVADPVRRDAISSALRETGRTVRDDERLVPLMLPLSDGVLCAARL